MTRQEWMNMIQRMMRLTPAQRELIADVWYHDRFSFWGGLPNANGGGFTAQLRVKKAVVNMGLLSRRDDGSLYIHDTDVKSFAAYAATDKAKAAMLFYEDNLRKMSGLPEASYRDLIEFWDGKDVPDTVEREDDKRFAAYMVSSEARQSSIKYRTDSYDTSHRGFSDIYDDQWLADCLRMSRKLGPVQMALSSKHELGGGTLTFNADGSVVAVMNIYDFPPDGDSYPQDDDDYEHDDDYYIVTGEASAVCTNPKDVRALIDVALESAEDDASW